MERLVLVARLKPGARDQARELIAAYPEATAIEAAFARGGVFLAEDEVVFFLEGEDAGESVRAMLNDPVRSSAIGPWLPLFDGPVQDAREAYFWKNDRSKGEQEMLGWIGDIERATLDNTTFRTVLFTGEHTQLTVMRLGPGEDIGREVHSHLDQFIRIEEGQARLELGRTEDGIDETHDVEPDWAVIVPAGIWHNVVNTGDGEVKLYSLYSPPEHPAETVHRTKAEAEAAHAHHA